MTIVHYIQCAGSSPRKTVLVLVFHVHHTRIFHVLTLISLPGPTCYLELARGFTYTLHVGPPRDGAHVLTPDTLKGPPMSFLQCLDTSVA